LPNRPDILITIGGAKCEYRGGAKSGCQTQTWDGVAQLFVEKLLLKFMGPLSCHFPGSRFGARYSYQENVPFLARNFGTFGVHFGYDLFDGGRKHGLMRERQAQLSQAKENLAKLTDAVELSVETAYNKLERTRQMLKVSEEVLALRTESSRVRQQELIQGAALNSQADTAGAQEYYARALLLQSQMDYLQVHDELLDAIGSPPE
jgi:outer membrane protein TolC